MTAEDRAALAGFDGTVRLFPLPNLVLFPNVVQGLHVFEPRYRQLAADALEGNQLIALVLLKEGWDEDYDRRPPIADVACIGRISQHERMPDGRYNLRLRGLSRVRLVAERETDKKYRVADGTLLEDEAPTELTALAELRRGLADAVLPRFDPGGPAHKHLAELFAGEMPLGHLCDVLAYALPVPVEFKQTLLGEPNVEARVHAMARALAVPTPAAGRRFPPDFSTN